MASKATQKSPNSSVKLALTVLGILLAIVLLSKLISILGLLHQPFSQDVLVKKQYTWDSKSTVNLVVKGDAVSVLNFDPNTKQLTILNVPGQTYFELPKGFGSWPVGSIYGLGQEEKAPVGAELLKQSIADLLGLPVDGFVIIDNPDLASQPLDKVIGSFKNPLALVSIFKSIQTDLTPLEALNIFHSIASVRPDKITHLDLGQSDITTSKLLADDSRVLGVDTIALDLFIRNKMGDSKLLQEELPVAIFNATDHPGLAAEAARIITNMGGNVIFTSNTDVHFEQTLMVYNHQSATEERIGEVFSPKCLSGTCKVDDPRILSERADINLVLGEDFYKNHDAK